MRHNSSNRRPRGRNNRGKTGGNNGRTQVFDSNGPEVRIRGTAHQISEKYEALAKDARSSGDMVLAESYLQHAEHYQRMVVAWNDEAREREEQQAARQPHKQEQGKQEQGKQDQASHQEPERKVIQAGNDDLGLPASILGDSIDVADAPAQEKAVLENA